jgi:hypothetical protein
METGILWPLNFEGFRCKYSNCLNRKGSQDKRFK